MLWKDNDILISRREGWTCVPSGKRRSDGCEVEDEGVSQVLVLYLQK